MWNLVAVLSVLGSAVAYPNGVAQRPAMGWNTWCTEASCEQPSGVVPPTNSSMHDVCDYEMFMTVAKAMLANGMYELGFDSVHADDCWAWIERDSNGNLQADPNRFPMGWKGLAEDMRALGFTNGLYTSAGNDTCSSGGRHGHIPGSFGHYKQDAMWFAEQTVDYVKIDFCGDHVRSAQQQHEEFSAGLNASGRPIWLELCRGYSYPPPLYTQQVAQSARVSGDHHDDWLNTLGVIASLAAAADTGLSSAANGYWGYGDFLMTGGAGCNVNATTHCPGMSDTEYETEMAIWTITNSPLIVATDVRNMTAIMRKLLLNSEMIAVNQDVGTPGGRIIGFHDCNSVVPGVCQLWGRNMTDGSAVAVLFNADAAPHTVVLDFDMLGPAFAGKTLHVRDLIQRTDDGAATGSISASLQPHAVKYVRLTHGDEPPLDVPRKPLTPAAREYLRSIGK